MYLINESLENYIPNIKERNNEYLTKIAAKFKEYEDKFKIKVEKNIFIDYIKEKYPNMDFTEDLNSDINNRKFSLDAFIVYDIGKNIISFQQIDTKENKENKEKDNEKEGNCIVDIKNTKEDYEFNLGNNNININNNNNQENIINNANFMDNINNTNNININQIGNSSKIFQSLKMNENKLKIFSSKIEVNEGKEEENNNVEQNQNKNS